MIVNKNYVRICVLDYLSTNTRVNLKNKFRFDIFTKAIQKCGTKSKDLADSINLTKDKINKWRRGENRPTLGAILKISRLLHLDRKLLWNQIKNFGSTGGKEVFTLPYSIQFNEDLAWFFGFRDGDGFRANPLIIGACAAPKEIQLLCKYKNIFDSFIKTSNPWSVYIRSKDEDLSKKAKTFFNNCRIYQYTHSKRSDEEGVINLQLGSRVLNKFFNKIEQHLENILLNSPESVKCSYLKGFFDSDGHVDIHGNLVLSQTKSAYARIIRVEKLLENLNIRFKTFLREGKFSLIIYSIKDYKKKIGFESNIKAYQLDQLIKCFDVLRDDTDISNKIIENSNKPITKKELMFKLSTKYGKMSNAINRLVKEGTLRVLKQKPLTVINV